MLTKTSKEISQGDTLHGRKNMDILTKKVTSKKVRGNNVDFSTIEITSRKVDANDMDFSTSKITPMKGRGNHMNFLAIEIASKKVRGNNVDFSISKIKSKKVRGNDADFSISEITSKKYVKMTRKFVKIYCSTYRRQIDVESTWIWSGVPVGWRLSKYLTWILFLAVFVVHVEHFWTWTCFEGFFIITDNNYKLLKILQQVNVYLNKLIKIDELIRLSNQSIQRYTRDRKSKEQQFLFLKARNKLFIWSLKEKKEKKCYILIFEKRHMKEEKNMDGFRRIF